MGQNHPIYPPKPKHYRDNPNVLPVEDMEDQTEQEHLDSCDINKMIQNVHRGIQVRGKQGQPLYGFDDTTLGGLDYRISKQRLEEQLSDVVNTHEFTPEELAFIPPDVAAKFKFKTKASLKPDDKPNEPNEPNSPKNDASKKEKATKAAPSEKTTNE